MCFFFDDYSSNYLLREHLSHEVPYQSFYKHVNFFSKVCIYRLGNKYIVHFYFANWGFWIISVVVWQMVNKTDRLYLAILFIKR